MVYASEGMRGTLVPNYPHLSSQVTLGVLAAVDVVLLAVGLHRFQKKAVL